MTRIRPQSLSGLLSAALLLIVLPLTAALVYGGVQLRELSRTSDVLVRDSITLTQHTQRQFQDIALMERQANLYSVTNDPRFAAAFDTHYAASSARWNRSRTTFPRRTSSESARPAAMPQRWSTEPRSSS
jgi:hypothetical protein